MKTSVYTKKAGGMNVILGTTIWLASCFIVTYITPSNMHCTLIISAAWNNKNLFSYSSGNQKSKLLSYEAGIKMSTELFLLKALIKPASLPFLQLLKAICIPWPMASSLPLTSCLCHHFFPTDLGLAILLMDTFGLHGPLDKLGRSLYFTILKCNFKAPFAMWSNIFTGFWI